MRIRRLAAVPAVCALAALSLGALTGTGSAAAAPADTTYTWDLAHDMGQDYVDNPIADSYGNHDVWTYQDGQLGGETSQFTTLANYQDVTQCNAAFHTGDGGFPAVAYHYVPYSENCGTPTYPGHSVLVHPANNGDSAVVKWTSPINGSVEVQADFTDEDPNGGDGITYQFSDANGSSIDPGFVANGSDSGPVTFSTSVEVGQPIYVEVGPNGSYDFDTTKLDLVITGHAASMPQPASINTHVVYGRTTHTGMTKVTIKAGVVGATGGPAPTGTVTASAFTCKALRPIPNPAKSVAICTGYFPPGSYEDDVDYSGDGVYQPARTVVTFQVGTAS